MLLFFIRGTGEGDAASFLALAMGARHSAPPTHASDVVAPTDGSPSAPRRSSSETELSPPQRALSGTIYSDAAASEPPRLSLSGLSRRRSLSRGVSRLISKRLLRRRAREASEAPDEEVFEEDEEGEEEAESEGELGNDEDLDENCIVCMDQPRDATVMPCRHMCEPASTPASSRSLQTPRPACLAGFSAAAAQARCATARTCSTAALFAAQRSSPSSRRTSSLKRRAARRRRTASSPTP